MRTRCNTVILGWKAREECLFVNQMLRYRTPAAAETTVAQTHTHTYVYNSHTHTNLDSSRYFPLARTRLSADTVRVQSPPPYQTPAPPGTPVLRAAYVPFPRGDGRCRGVGDPPHPIPAGDSEDSPRPVMQRSPAVGGEFAEQRRPGRSPSRPGSSQSTGGPRPQTRAGRRLRPVARWRSPAGAR